MENVNREETRSGEEIMKERLSNVNPAHVKSFF